MKISTKPRPKTVYEPAVFGNRRLPLPERVRVTIEPLSVAEYESIRISVVDPRSRDFSSAGRKLRDEVIRRRVVAVENLNAVDEHDVSTPITTGAQLVDALGASSDAAHTDLLDEIYQAAIDSSVLDEGRAKN